SGSETQEITGTPAASGPYAGYLIFELKVEGKTVGTFWNQSAPNPQAGWQPATAANIQSALEAAYGAGNVEVTGDPIGTLSVTVKTPVPVAPVVYTPYDNLPQYFGEGEAVVTVAGKSSGQTVVVSVANIGDAQVSASGVPITITDKLPDGVEAYQAESFTDVPGQLQVHLSCSITTVSAASTVSCPYDGTVAPFQVFELYIAVNVTEGAKTADNSV